MIRSLAARQWASAAMCVVAFALSAAFSISAALGSQSSVRTEAASAVAERIAARSRAQEALARATGDLAALPTARLAGQVEADLARLAMKLPADVDCGGWVSDKRQRTLCVERHGLEGELAIAQRRVELEAAANDAREALDNLASGAGPATANADAQTIARFAASLGYPIGADRVGDLLVILSVTLLELGGGLAFAVAGALRPSQPLECSLQGKQAGQGGALVAVPATADVEAQAERWGVPAIAAADVSPESPVAVETAPAASVELVPAATAKTARKAGTAPKRKLSQPSNVHPKPRRQNRVRPVACESQAEAGERILKLVSSSPDGTLPATGVRGLAKLIDASRATTHRALVGLVSTGVLAHAGDAIVLAAPGRAAA